MYTRGCNEDRAATKIRDSITTYTVKFGCVFDLGRFRLHVQRLRAELAAHPHRKSVQPKVFRKGASVSHCVSFAFALTLHERRRHAAQFAIDARSERVQGPGVAIGPGKKKLR